MRKLIEARGNEEVIRVVTLVEMNAEDAFLCFHGATKNDKKLKLYHHTPVMNKNDAKYQVKTWRKKCERDGLLTQLAQIGSL